MTQIHYFKIQIPKGTTTQHILIISNKHILILVRTTNRDAYTHQLSATKEDETEHKQQRTLTATKEDE